MSVVSTNTGPMNAPQPDVNRFDADLSQLAMINEHTYSANNDHRSETPKK